MNSGDLMIPLFQQHHNYLDDVQLHTDYMFEIDRGWDFYQDLFVQTPGFTIGLLTKSVY